MNTVEIAREDFASLRRSKGVSQSERRIVGVEIARGGRSYERSFAVLIIVPGSFQRDVLADNDIHCGKR